MSSKRRSISPSRTRAAAAKQAVKPSNFKPTIKIRDCFCVDIVKCNLFRVTLLNDGKWKLINYSCWFGIPMKAIQKLIIVEQDNMMMYTGSSKIDLYEYVMSGHDFNITAMNEKFWQKATGKVKTTGVRFTDLSMEIDIAEYNAEMKKLITNPIISRKRKNG